MKTKQRKIKFLERKEVEKLIAGIKPEGERNLRDRALIEVLFSTGMRISEALALPDAPFAKDLQGTLELSIVGKGGWSRTVYFSPQTIRAIKAYLAVREDSNMVLFPITSRCAQIMTQKRAKEAGMDKRVNPHMFRHSFGTYILGKTGNIRLCQELLGHRSITSTEVYTHITSPQLKEAHRKLFNSK